MNARVVKVHTNSEFFNLYIYNGALLEIRAIFGKKENTNNLLLYHKSFPSFVLQYLRRKFLYIRRIDQ